MPARGLLLLRLACSCDSPARGCLLADACSCGSPARGLLLLRLACSCGSPAPATRLLLRLACSCDSPAPATRLLLRLACSCDSPARGLLLLRLACSRVACSRTPAPAARLLADSCSCGSPARGWPARGCLLADSCSCGSPARGLCNQATASAINRPISSVPTVFFPSSRKSSVRYPSLMTCSTAASTALASRSRPSE
jgi:hypothetical protein